MMQWWNDRYYLIMSRFLKMAFFYIWKSIKNEKSRNDHHIASRNMILCSYVKLNSTRRQWSGPWQGPQIFNQTFMIKPWCTLNYICIQYCNNKAIITDSRIWKIGRVVMYVCTSYTRWHDVWCDALPVCS